MEWNEASDLAEKEVPTALRSRIPGGADSAVAEQTVSKAQYDSTVRPQM